MSTYLFSSFPIDQQDDLPGLEQRLAEAAGALPFPFRLLALSRGFNLAQPLARNLSRQRALERLGHGVQPVLEQIAALLRGEAHADPGAMLRALPADLTGQLLSMLAHDPLLQQVLTSAEIADGDEARVLWAALHDTLSSLLGALLWRLPLSKHMEEFYRVLQSRQLRSATYLLITWEPPHVSSQAVATTLRNATQRPVTILDQLPPLLEDAYQEQGTRLAPEEPGMPWLAGLLAYDVRGVWDAATLHGLLDVTYDVALAIDVHTYRRPTAMQKAELAHNAARVVARDQQVMDLRAHRVMAAAEHVMHELVRQNLHSVQIAALVGGTTAEELEANVAETTSRLGSQLRFMRPLNSQRELLKLWSLAPRSRIDAPLKPRTMLSHGVGCCFGLLGYHRPANTDGVLWGVDNRRLAPLFFDLFRDNQAAHMVVIGKSGYGKSFFLNVLALRNALEGYRVIGIDAFRNAQRIARASLGGARCYALSMRDSYNPLDIVYREEDWLPSQVAHAQRMLSLILGRSVARSNGRADLFPREFSGDEESVLDQALTELYAPLDPEQPRSAMPLLSDLMTVLECLGEPESDALARSIRLFISRSSRGQRFNTHTTVEWRFDADVTYYDLSGVPAANRVLVALLFMDGVQQFMRDPTRDVSRPTALLIDEFAYMARIKAFAEVASEITKVARKYGMALVAVDQSPQVFLDSDYGRDIFDNAAARVLFRMDAPAAARIGEALSDLRPHHLAYLTQAQRGMALAVVGNDVYPMNVEATPHELRMLRGS